MSARAVIRRALLSVSDKSGLVEFARGLAAHGVELISTGGTERALREAGVAVREVSAVTGFPEIMDGRVKTLHPRIHGGLLGREPLDRAVMAEHGIEPIDLLVVNLYPFERVSADPAATLEQAVENIDIGGPAMLRAAAKNHERVAVVVDARDYDEVLGALAAGGTTLEQRRRLAAKAYAHTARYDGLIAMYLGARAEDPREPFPPTFQLALRRGGSLRYGENPHQSAALFLETDPAPGTVANARVLAGKALSYNNLADADAALECAKQFHASSTPIPAAWPKRIRSAMRTTAPMPATRFPRSEASSRSTARSTATPRA
jgi:phosphoribosylaminoimidazolecarboxamide formyltransferase/IMP cyclohydrolase